jgi:hypothetical protein
VDERTLRERLSDPAGADPALAEPALADPDPTVRGLAIAALAAHARAEPAERPRVARLIAGVPDVIDRLVAALAGPDRRVGANAAWAAALLLTPTGDEPTAWTEEQALEVLGRLPGARVAALIAALAIGEGDERARTVGLLGCFVADAGAALAVLTAELAKTDPPAEVVAALRRLGPKARAAVPALLAAIERGALGAGAFDAVEEIGADGPVELRKSVEQILAKAGPRARAGAYVFLSRQARGTPDEIAPHLRALCDPSGIVRAAAAAAIAKWDRWRLLDRARELSASLALLEDEPRRRLREALAPAIDATLEGWVATPFLVARFPELQPLARTSTGRRPRRPQEAVVDVPDAATARQLGAKLDAARESVRGELEPLRAALDAPSSGREGAHRKLGERLEQVLQHKVAPTGLMVISRATKGTEGCPLCGHSVNVGTFELRRLDEPNAIALPYMAVHALLVHGMPDWDSPRNGAGAVDVTTVKRWIGG